MHTTFLIGHQGTGKTNLVYQILSGLPYIVITSYEVKKIDKDECHIIIENPPFLTKGIIELMNRPKKVLHHKEGLGSYNQRLYIHSNSLQKSDILKVCKQLVTQPYSIIEISNH